MANTLPMRPAEMYLFGISGTDFVVSNKFTTDNIQATYGENYGFVNVWADDGILYNATNLYDATEITDHLFVPLYNSSIMIIKYAQKMSSFITHRWDQVEFEYSEDEGISWMPYSPGEGGEAPVVWNFGQLSDRYPLYAYVAHQEIYVGTRYNKTALWYRLKLSFEGNYVTEISRGPIFFTRGITLNIDGYDNVDTGQTIDIEDYQQLKLNTIYDIENYRCVTVKNDTEEELFSEDEYTTVDPSSDTTFFFRLYDRNTDTLVCETDPLLILSRYTGPIIVE